MQTAGYRTSQNNSQQRSTATKPPAPALGGKPLDAFAAGATSSLTTDSHSMLSPGENPLAGRSFGRLAYAIYQLDRYFRLPDGPRSFAIFTIVLMFVVAGMVVQVLLSAQILQAETRLHAIQKQHQILQQQNSEFVWQIARETNLQRSQARVAELGYRPVTAHSFVVLPGSVSTVTPPNEIEDISPDIGPEVDIADPPTTEHLTTEPAAKPDLPATDEAMTIITTGPAVANQSDAPLDRWLGLLLPRPERPVTEARDIEPQTEPPGQWWRNVWQQSRQRATDAIETVQDFASK